jgi:hypothetical protein
MSHSAFMKRMNGIASQFIKATVLEIQWRTKILVFTLGNISIPSTLAFGVLKVKWCALMVRGFAYPESPK